MLKKIDLCKVFEFWVIKIPWYGCILSIIINLFSLNWVDILLSIVVMFGLGYIGGSLPQYIKKNELDVYNKMLYKAMNNGNFEFTHDMSYALSKAIIQAIFLFACDIFVQMCRGDFYSWYINLIIALIISTLLVFISFIIGISVNIIKYKLETDSDNPTDKDFS